MTRAHAHINAMTAASTSTPSKRVPPPGTRGWYRGVKLVDRGPTRLPREVIERAIKDAIRKHADEIARLG